MDQILETPSPVSSNDTAGLQFRINREALLDVFRVSSGMADRTQAFPILQNLLLEVSEDGVLSITASNTEIELMSRIQLEEGQYIPGSVTCSARKLSEICSALPAGSEVEMQLMPNQRMVLQAGTGSFRLATLPAVDFPRFDQAQEGNELVLEQGALRSLIDRTQFCIANQDVRYYLNGLLFDIKDGKLNAVATDGHRLALDSLALNDYPELVQKVIIPKKSIQELRKILNSNDSPVTLLFAEKQLRVSTDRHTFITKYIDGKFPDYNRVIPPLSSNQALGDRGLLHGAFNRVGTLANEKYKGVSLKLSENHVSISANNPEHEEAQEELLINYAGDSMEIGFNVTYLKDALDAVGSDEVSLSFSGLSAPLLIQDSPLSDAKYVIMPLRL